MSTYKELAARILGAMAVGNGYLISGELRKDVGRALNTMGDTKAPEGAEEYFLQDSRSYVGNCPLFWRKGGGYTTRIDEAERFTKEAAERQHKDRDTDKIWPCDVIIAISRPTIDCQDMRGLNRHTGG